LGTFWGHLVIFKIKNLAHNWLSSKATDVKRFNSSLKKLSDGRKAGYQHQPQEDSSRSVVK